MTNHTEITARLVETVEPPATGQCFIRDTQLPGFALRVTAAGTRSFIVEARVNGRTRRVTLGKHPVLSLKDARKKAKQILGQFAFGQDVVAERQAAQAKAITLEEVLTEYLASRDLKSSTVRDYQKLLAGAFEDWRHKPIVEITRDMVERRHAQLGERSKTRANYAMRVLRALINYASAKYEDAEGKPIIMDNPVKRLSATRAWYRVDPRRTIIKHHELPAWFNAVATLESQNATPKVTVTRDYLFFLLFTGLRREEAARLQWTDVDFDGRTFIVGDTKNREPHELPLSDFLYDLLARRKVEAGTSPYVFPGNRSGCGYIVEPRRWLLKIAEESGVEFTLHDLRRTFITVAESLDIPAYALKRLLNHKTGGDVTAGYIVIGVERLREPMQKITDFILKAANVKPTADVVNLQHTR